MAIDRAGTLIDLLREHHLLETAQLEEVGRTPDVTDTDPRLLGQCLIELGWLTPYQLDRLIQNRPQDLFLGPYHLLDRLGQGETGPVFQARKPGKAGTVALKIIPKPRLADPQRLAQFQQEVRTAAQLQHPNIAPVAAVGQQGNLFLVAREFVPGADLGRMVRELGPLPPFLACNAVRQAALALQCAHDKGLSHRRVKASNLIVVDQPGTEAAVKLVDFGLGQLKPGASADLDVPGDLAALGQTLSFLLTGQTSPTADALPAEVGDVVRRFAPDATDRFYTAWEASQALEPLSHEPPTAEPVSVNGVAVEPAPSPIACSFASGANLQAMQPAVVPLEGIAVPVMGTVGIAVEPAEPAVAFPPALAPFQPEPIPEPAALAEETPIASPEPAPNVPLIEPLGPDFAGERPAADDWPPAPAVSEPILAPTMEAVPPPPMEAFAPSPFGASPEPAAPVAASEPVSGGYFMDQPASTDPATEAAGAFPMTSDSEGTARRAPGKKKWSKGTILWIIVGALLHLVAAVILVVAIMALMKRDNPPPKNNRPGVPGKPKGKSQAGRLSYFEKQKRSG